MQLCKLWNSAQQLSSSNSQSCIISWFVICSLARDFISLFGSSLTLMLCVLLEWFLYSSCSSMRAPVDTSEAILSLLSLNAASHDNLCPSSLLNSSPSIRNASEISVVWLQSSKLAKWGRNATAKRKLRLSSSESFQRNFVILLTWYRAFFWFWYPTINQHCLGNISHFVGRS